MVLQLVVQQGANEDDLGGFESNLEPDVPISSWRSGIRTYPLNFSMSFPGCIHLVDLFWGEH